MENQDLFIASELQRRFFFFMLGLTAAVLAASITNFKPYAIMSLNFVELSCWLLLAVSVYAIIMCIRSTISYHTSVGILASDHHDWTTRKIAKQEKPKSMKQVHIFSIIFYTSFTLASAGLLFNRLYVAIASM